MGVSVLLALGKPKHWDPFKEGTHIIYLYIYIYVVCSIYFNFNEKLSLLGMWELHVIACGYDILYIYILNRCTKYELAFPLPTKNQRANELRPESH